VVVVALTAVAEVAQVLFVHALEKVGGGFVRKAN
jgi:hypothetical protein